MWPVTYDKLQHYNRDCTVTYRWWWEYPSSPSPVWSPFQLCRICTLAPTPLTMSGRGQVQGRTDSSAVDQVTGWRRRLMWVTHSSGTYKCSFLSFFRALFLPLLFSSFLSFLLTYLLSFFFSFLRSFFVYSLRSLPKTQLTPMSLLLRI